MTTPDEELPAARETLVDALLRPDGIRAHLQPVVRVADSAIVGHEVLSRSTAYPRTSPATWLAAAEEVGRRAEVELACLEAAAELGEPPDRALLFVNVSPDVLVGPEFGELAKRLPRHVIEVTEHAAVEAYEPLREALSRLRGNGSLVAVDDVGAGYASMAHVLQLNPSFIKIDRSLVQGLDGDPGRRALVEALQAFAAAVGALTIAEGVETEDELRALREMGVDLAQGYLLARPSQEWAEVSAAARRVLVPEGPPPAATDDRSLARELEEARTAAAACDVVGRYLARHGGLLPSVYLERGGVLRCHSRRGQWLVMDGLRPGVGITGAAFATGSEIVQHDVAGDQRYRLAVPGVCAEIAVPLRIDGVPVGALNVDAVAPLHEEHLQLVRRCGRLLEDRLAELRTHGRVSTVLHDVAALAPTLALTGSAPDLGHALLEAARELTGYDSGCLWHVDPDPSAHAAPGHHGLRADAAGRPRATATTGPDGAALAHLAPQDVAVLVDLVADLSSCYSGGTDLSLDAPPTQVLRTLGVRGAVIVPIRDGWRQTDLLVLTSAATAYVAPDAVDALELLCLQAGSRLAALRRVAELEELVHRDALTGVGNRGLWQMAVGDLGLDAEGRPGRRRDSARDPMWVAVADVDRFKAVNDGQGHLTGDELLRRLAETFAALPGWSVFRLGGDEFALFGPADDDATWPGALETAVGRAQAVLAEYGATVSVGAALTTRDRLALAHARADRALYRRKRAGGAGLTVATAGPETGATPLAAPGA